VARSTPTPPSAKRPLPEWARGPRLREIDLKRISPSTTNPRKTFDDLEDLTDSIRLHGVLMPVLIRPLTLKKQGYELVAGERRWRSARKAGLETIPARIENFTDQEAREAQLIENLQREDLTVLEEASGFKALLQGGEYDVREIATACSRSVQYVYQRIQLLNADGQILDALGNGVITAAHALLFSRLDPELQREIFDFGVMMDFGEERAFVPVQRLRSLIEQFSRVSLAEMPWSIEDKTLGGTPCDVCIHNSSCQGTLWDDIEKKDTCANALCATRKFAAFLKQKAADAGLESCEYVSVGTVDYWAWARGPVGRRLDQELGQHPLGPYRFTHVPKSFKGRAPKETKAVVVLSSIPTIPVGAVVRITTQVNWNPKTAKADATPPKTEDVARSRALVRLVRQRQEFVIEQARAKIRAGVCWPPQDRVVLEVVTAVIERLYNDLWIRLAKARGWVDRDGKKVRHWDRMSDKVKEALGALDNQDLLGVAMEALLIDELSVDPADEVQRGGGLDRRRLAELGPLFEFELKDLVKEARKAIKAPPAKKKKAAKKKAPAKKKAAAKKKAGVR